MTLNRSRVIAERISPLRRGSSRTLMTAFLTLLPIRTAAIKASIHSTEAVTRARPPLNPRSLQMSAPRWRWSVIGVWLALACITFVALDSMALRSWLLLVVVGVIPPAMLLWAWNEDRPLPIGSLRPRRERL